MGVYRTKYRQYYVRRVASLCMSRNPNQFFSDLRKNRGMRKHLREFLAYAFAIPNNLDIGNMASIACAQATATSRCSFCVPFPARNSI
jgi:hypothetical protein